MPEAGYNPLDTAKPASLGARRTIEPTFFAGLLRAAISSPLSSMLSTRANRRWATYPKGREMAGMMLSNFQGILSCCATID